MNLNQLKIFYLAAKRENLSRAGEELNITQPAVTKGIQRIQDFYDIRLVNRFGKKLALTDAGEALFEIAEKIFDLETQAEESIREFQSQKRGRIRIDASESFGAYYLPPIINAFSKKNPSIRLSVNILPTQQVVANAAGLENDIGFISYYVAHKKVVTKNILEDQLWFVTAPRHPLLKIKHLTSMNLSGESMVVHEKGSVQSRAVNKFVKDNRIAVKIGLELSSNRAIKKAIEDGLGVALLNRKVVSEEIRTGTLVRLPLPGTPMTRNFYLVHHKDKYIPDVLGRLITEVHRWCSDYMQTLI
jgi:DNA-binding transcriptional LysR family regulator